jgi:hypothetical protein
MCSARDAGVPLMFRHSHDRHRNFKNGLSFIPSWTSEKHPNVIQGIHFLKKKKCNAEWISTLITGSAAELFNRKNDKIAYKL